MGDLPVPIKRAMVQLEGRGLPHYLTRDQVHQLIAACKRPRDRLLIAVAWQTGARVSELIDIRRGDIDFTNRQIRLRTLKKRTDRRRRRPLAHRWIPVQDSLVADLATYLMQNPIAPPGQGTDDRVFQIRRIGAYRAIRRVAHKAGIKAPGGRPVSPHILRHSFAVNCLYQGMPISVLKELLGHASVLSTMVYLKVAPTDAKEFLGKVQF